MYPGIEFPPKRGEINIRLMESVDLDAVTAIERDSSPSPWNRSLFAGCLGTSYFCLVAIADNKVIAFGISSLVIDEGTIVNIGVDVAYQGYGCGNKVLCRLLENLANENASKVYLEVRVSNQTAIRLYRRVGFTQTGVRKDYYSLGHTREDAVLMEKKFL